MRDFIMPTTVLGKWSVRLAIIFTLFITLVIVFNLLRPEFNPVFKFITVIALISTSWSAFIIGFISVTTRKERSTLVFLGMAITLWLGLIGFIGYLFI